MKVGLADSECNDDEFALVLYICSERGKGAGPGPALTIFSSRFAPASDDPGIDEPGGPPYGTQNKHCSADLSRPVPAYPMD